MTTNHSNQKSHGGQDQRDDREGQKSGQNDRQDQQGGQGQKDRQGGQQAGQNDRQAQKDGNTDQHGGESRGTGGKGDTGGQNKTR